MTIGYLEDRIAKLEMEIQNLQEEHEALVEGVRYLRNEIAKNQTVDAEPIRHGRWEEKIKDGKLGYGFLTERFMACSVCGEKAHYDENEGWLLPRYCPNCGAKMDEVEEC